MLGQRQPELTRRLSPRALGTARASWPPILALAAACFVTSGCYTSHSRLSYSGPTRLDGPPIFEPAPPFRYTPHELQVTNHVVTGGGKPSYLLRELEMPSFGDNGQPEPVIHASYYQSLKPGRRPMVIVLPIWGTFTYPSRKMSNFIQNHSAGGAHVLHVHGERYLIDWEGLQNATEEQAFMDVWREGIEHQRITVIDVRRLIDWAEQRPEIDSERIGLIGFSFGAVVGGTILTQEPRLTAGVLVMGGALQHEILAHCTGERLTAIREKVAAEFGWTADELEARLEPVTRAVDAASYPGRVDPHGVFIIDAARDDCIGPASREALWDALGRPERMSMDYGHRKAFYSITPLGLNWMRYRIWDFLESRLLEPHDDVSSGAGTGRN